MFVEGKRTEEQYLKHWHRIHRDRVLVTVDDFRGEPLSLVQHARAAANREAREARRGRGRAHDEVWCVFDRDEHERFAEAVRLAADAGINLAISNPCIELWFLLHFQDQTAYIHRQDAQRISRELLQCSKVLTVDALGALETRYEDAVERAGSLENKHKGDGSEHSANPSSSVWRLIEVIRNAEQVR